MSSTMEGRKVLPQLNKWLEIARSGGARAAEILYEERVTHALSLGNGRRAEAGPTTQVRIDGRVYLEGGRTGSFTLHDPRPDRVEKAIGSAITSSRRAALNVHAGPIQRIGISERGHGIEDRRYDMLDAESRQEVLELNESAALGHEGIEVLAIDYQDARTERTYSATTENEGASADTVYRVRMHVRDTHTGDELDAVSEARTFSHVGSLPFGAELARRLIALRERAVAPEGPLPLVLESRVGAWLLTQLAPAFSAALCASGDSFVADRGPQLASSRVHLIDDPGLHGGLRTLPFDDRGVPPSPVAILREGMRGGLYQSPETAREADIRPTGHVFDGALQPTNLILRPGNRSRTQMLSEVPVCLSFDRLEGSLDLKTGRLSCWGPAFVLEKGRPKGALPRVALDVDVVDLLLQVQEVAADQERYRSVDCATLLIREAPTTW